MEDTFAQPHDPGFASPLEESAVAAEIERIKQDPRRRATMDLENETLYAARTVAIAQATMKRNAKLRHKLERELYDDYTKPVVRSFVPDPTRPAFPIFGVTLAITLIVAGAAMLIIPNRMDALAANASETTVATSTPAIAEPVTEKTVPLTPEQVEARIRELAKEANFAWTDYLVKLAKCESGLRPDALNIHNNVPTSSKDRGVFQINSYHHKEVSDADAFDLDTATRWTMWRIESGHQGEWVCDGRIKK